MHNRYLLDTNVLIYSLNRGLELPEAIYFTTDVTKNEILSYELLTAEDKDLLENIFKQIKTLELNNAIHLNALKLAQKYDLTKSDSIICATAYAYELTLITNDQLLHQVKEIQIEPFYFV